MLGLSQLKKLSEDVLKLGNEPALRAERGEKPARVQIPVSVKDIDDSEDFVLGMPEKQSEPADGSPSDDGVSSEDQEFLDAAGDELESLLSASSPSDSEPDLSSILTPPGGDADDIPDLSAFEDEPPLAEEVPDAGADSDGASGLSPDDFSIDDMFEPLPDTLDGGMGIESMPDLPDFGDAPGDTEGGSSGSDGSDGTVSAGAEDFGSDAGDAGGGFPSGADDSVADSGADDFDFSGSEIDLNEDIPPEFREVPSPEVPSPEVPSPEVPSPDASSPDVSFTDVSGFDGTPVSEDSPLDAGSFDLDAVSEPAEEESAADEIPTSGDSGFDALDTAGLDSFGGEDSSLGNETSGNETFQNESFSNAGDFDLDSSMESDFSDSEPDASGGSPAENSDFDISSLDIPGMDGDETAGGQPDFSEGQTPEVFDTSQMDGIDFDAPAQGDSSLSDFNLPDTGSQLGGDSDFSLGGDGDGDSDFEILGYTGEDANPFDKHGRIKSQIPDTPEEHQKNTLTDAEYKKFKANLQSYPLNVRLAVEDMIVKNEFTDDVVFEVIEKVVKKIPARQLASHLEKMLDIQISVPRDFERRTAEEYEAYKASIQYQLKNKIIPGILIGIFLFMIGFCSVYLGVEYIVKPIKAENLYRQGYTLLENEEYPQSEMKFNDALKLRQKKKWFFRYADGYRRHKQYDRAELMYKNILKRFNHDKQGGMEYARMELDDLANYERAEEIVKREILDWHINDLDAMLLLGDVYLEWATEEDPSKFQLAYDQYSNLMQLPKAPEACNARMMIYNVRTDNLKNVLTYKEMFYPDEKSLTGAEWTEMSGYLMDKLYGDLTPQEKYLHNSIEDVHSMLLRAVKTDPLNPISRYNISRYYVESGDHTKALENLNRTVELFDNAKSIKKRDTYKQINTYRLLGEQHLYNGDFILAQTTLADGIELFEDKHASSGFESDKNVGIMYSDMADIDYFISGDLENAERNYMNSVNNKNDTPSIRYRVGYINYSEKDYETALRNFMIASREKSGDTNLLLALANTLSLRDDNFAAAGYYNVLMDSLDLQISRRDILLPQVNDDDGELVGKYMRASNNLGVSQYKIARQTGNSALNGESLNNLQNSLRAWDALTRNQTTMVRLGGTNLAEQNIRYIVNPVPSYEPAIYTEIPRILENENGIE